MNKVIYYFSGTGNSYCIARDIGAQLTGAKIINMCQQKKTKYYAVYSVVGLIFPLYYFGLPVIVEQFIKNLEMSSNCYIFVIVTRGEHFAGGAKKQLDSIFLNKSKEYHLFRYITMGNNYPFHMFNCSTDKAKYNRNQKAKNKIVHLMNAIRTRQKCRIFSILDYSPFFWITRNIPIFGYYHFRTIYHNDTCFTVNSDKCKKCKKCEGVCPVNNISVTDRVSWKHENCQLCLACYNCCPTNAIQYVDKTNHINTEGKRQYWNNNNY